MPTQSAGITNLIEQHPDRKRIVALLLREIVRHDLIFTGTPAGVAAVQPGDLLEGRTDGLGELRVKIV